MTENAAYLQLITSHQISVLFRLINTYYHLHMYVYHVTINLDTSLVCFFCVRDSTHQDFSAADIDVLCHC